MADNQSEQESSPVNENKSESNLKDILTSGKLVIPDGEEPLWYLSREDMGILPVITEKLESNEERMPEWKVTKEDMGLIDIKDKSMVVSGPAYVSNDLSKTVEMMKKYNPDGTNPGIFVQSGTDFGQMLKQAFEDMQKSPTDTPKHVIVLTDGDNSDLIESLTTTTNNEEQKQKALKEIPDTEVKEVSNEVSSEEKKISWKEALREYFKTVETLPEGTTLDITFDGIPKVENEPVSKLDNIVLYSMEPPSDSVISEESKEELRKLLLERIKNVNANLSSENNNESDNKPKLK